MCVSSVYDLISSLLEKSHGSYYFIHVCVTKTYKDLERLYWLFDTRQDIEKFASKIQNCKEVKYEHQRHACLLQKMSIPEWKWERISWILLLVFP